MSHKKIYMHTQVPWGHTEKCSASLAKRNTNNGDDEMSQEHTEWVN